MSTSHLLIYFTRRITSTQSISDPTYVFLKRVIVLVRTDRSPIIRILTPWYENVVISDYVFSSFIHEQFSFTDCESLYIVNLLLIARLERLTLTCGVTCTSSMKRSSNCLKELIVRYFIKVIVMSEFVGSSTLSDTLTVQFIPSETIWRRKN